MRERLRQFMLGRYGVDDLGRFLNVLCVILLILGIAFMPQIYFLALALLIYTYFRILSRNVQRRTAENAAYLLMRRRIAGWFSTGKQRFAQRKTHRFYKCPSCSQTLRVPKGRGKITITCPKCKTHFTKKS